MDFGGRKVSNFQWDGFLPRIASEIDLKTYPKDGFVLTRGVLGDTDFADLEAKILLLVSAQTSHSYQSMQDAELVRAISEDPELEQYLYGEIRRHVELTNLSLNPALTDTAKNLLGDEIVLLEKIPFRIDCPMVKRELAVWHQDHFYVKGHVDTITAWVPLQDTTFREGCLMVMPGSHANGPIPHDVNVLKKKYYPSTIFDQEVRYVEMKYGDVLFIHSCLLHSSGNNVSDGIRFSVQARYVRARDESDASMGERIAVR